MGLFRKREISSGRMPLAGIMVGATIRICRNIPIKKKWTIAPVPV